MTEAEWLACLSPTDLLAAVSEIASERKLRLFGVSAIWPHVAQLDGADARQVLDAVDRAAEGLLNRTDLREERDKLRRWYLGREGGAPTPTELISAAGFVFERDPRAAAKRMVYAAMILAQRCESSLPGDADATELPASEVARECERRLAEYIRDIFGNPFRSCGITRQWRTSTVTALAQQMYESRDFGAMPILADALQDAGCTNEDVLNHCRRPGPHVRGCWVVDLVLGKS